MPREKAADPEKILSRVLRIRLTDAAFKRLEKIAESSDCHSVGEGARKILSKEKITLFYKDITLNSTMEELALVRKELRAIGININQVTKAFHSDNRETSQASQIIQLISLGKSVEIKTDALLVTEFIGDSTSWLCFFRTTSGIRGIEEPHMGKPHLHFISSAWGISREAIVKQLS